MGVTSLLEQLESNDVGLRFEAADQLEQLSRREPAELYPYRDVVLKIVSVTEQPGVQWHLALMLPRLNLTFDQATNAAAVLSRWLDTSPSSIVKADCLTALSGLAHQYRELMDQTKYLLAKALKYGSPAERARVRNLLGRTGQREP
jgi:hypothetical protein